MLDCTGLAPPQKRAPLPRQITFQRKRANRRVVNEDQLISLLKEFGQVGHRAVRQFGALSNLNLPALAT